MNTLSNYKKKPSSFFARTILFSFVFSIVFLPIDFNRVRFFILGLFVIISITVFIRFYKDIKIPRPPFMVQIAILASIYIYGTFIAILNGNNIDYMLQDSFGFLIYFVFPVLFLFVYRFGLSGDVSNAILITGIILALLHVGIFFIYKVYFWPLSIDSLMALNLKLSSLGLSWELGASGGLLRVNTKSGHFFLLVLSLLIIKHVKNPGSVTVLWISLVYFSILLDGHRALIISSFLVFIPVVFIYLYKIKMFFFRGLWLIIIICFGGVLIFHFLIDLDHLINRFLLAESTSVQTRFEQASSLVNKISQRPILGSGFGSHAEVIRNIRRPFMYEFDFLAVLMKLGIPVGMLYFFLFISLFLAPLLVYPRFETFQFFFLGVAYLFFMVTNGGFAMSPVTAFFHVVVMVTLAAFLLDAKRDIDDRTDV